MLDSIYHTISAILTASFVMILKLTYQKSSLIFKLISGKGNQAHDKNP